MIRLSRRDTCQVKLSRLHPLPVGSAADGSECDDPANDGSQTPRPKDAETSRVAIFIRLSASHQPFGARCNEGRNQTQRQKHDECLYAQVVHEARVATATLPIAAPTSKAAPIVAITSNFSSPLVTRYFFFGFFQFPIDFCSRVRQMVNAPAGASRAMVLPAAI